MEEIGAQLFKDPDYDSEGAWLASEGKAAVGYCDAIIDSARQAYGRKDAHARVEVLPESRGKGIEQELMAKALGFMKARGLESAQGWCYERDEWRRALLESSGFESVHKYFSMVREGGARPPPMEGMEGLTIRHRMLREASEEELTSALSVVNEAFSELFNHSPWTSERLANIRDSAEEIMRLTYAYLDGELAGVSLCEDSVPYNKQHGLQDGWINIIAVLKPYRRRGLGRQLMLDGMHWLCDRGLPVIHLGVDAENRMALGLYTSLGFEVLLENSIYMKRLK